MNGREFPGQHAALVSDDLWERANAAIRPVFELVTASRRCIITTTRVRTARRGSSAQRHSAVGSQQPGQRGVRRLRIGFALVFSGWESVGNIGRARAG